MADLSDTQPMPTPPDPPRKPEAEAAKAGFKLPFPIPWGLFVILGFYGLAVLGYIWATYWRTPEYQAAEEIERAKEVLGPSNGDKLDQKHLELAYSHFLEAARLTPGDRRLQEHLQQMRYEMDERHMTLSHELVMRSEAMAVLLQRIETEDAPLLVVGARDRGWTPELVLGGPRTAVLWSIPPAILFSIFYFFRIVTERRIRTEGKEAESKKLEQELIDLQRARTLGSVNEDGTFKEIEGDVLMQGREKKKKPVSKAPAPAAEPERKKTVTSPALVPRPQKKK